MIRKRNLLLIFSFFVALCLTGCHKKEAKNSGKPIVYASFYPVYDLVDQVAGDTIDLRTFMPLDKNPHLWEPTPKDLKELSEADLLVVNGANLERWTDQVKDNLPDLEVLTLSNGVELITYKGAAAVGDFSYMAEQKAERGKEYKIDFGHTHEDIMRVAWIDNSEDLSFDQLVEKGKKIMEGKGKLVPQKATIDVEPDTIYALEMGHEHGEIYYRFPKAGKWVFIADRQSEQILSYSLMDIKTNQDLDVEVLLEGSTSGMDKITYDPHSWLSPMNGKAYLNSINDTLGKLYPKNARDYNKNKVNAVAELTDLEYEYKNKFKECDLKEFVVTHYAYEYLAREFDLIQFPLQGLVSTESPSLKTIKKAVGFSQAKGINTIFYEYSNDPKSAKTLAEEIGGDAVGLISMEYQTTNMTEDTHYQDIIRYNLEELYKSFKK
ncbi:MAG: metal ABC transporter substrate-binding protein [Tissierellia bacterium]|nr:metal ABC transporter substrate-binding protein [Tissierellia bacterium]